MLVLLQMIISVNGLNLIKIYIPLFYKRCFQYFHLLAGVPHFCKFLFLEISNTVIKVNFLQVSYFHGYLLLVLLLSYKVQELLKREANIC